MFDTPKQQTKGSFFDSMQSFTSCYISNPVMQRELNWNGRIVQKEMTMQYRKLKDHIQERQHFAELIPFLERRPLKGLHSSSLPPTRMSSQEKKFLQIKNKQAGNQGPPSTQIPNVIMSPRNMRIHANEIRREVLKKFTSNSPSVSPHFHRSQQALKNEIEDNFNILKEEWEACNVPLHHKEAFAEMLKHLAKEEVLGVLQKEIKKIRNGQSLIQNCMKAVEDREKGLSELKTAINEFEVESDQNDPEQIAFMIENISQLLVAMRQFTLYAVESIIKWKDFLAKNMSNVVNEKNQPFLIVYYYNSDNYLLIVQSDMADLCQSKVNKYFMFSQTLDPFLMSLTLQNKSLSNHIIVHFIPKTIQNRIKLLEDRLSRELAFSEENERCQQLKLFNPSGSMMSTQENSTRNCLIRIRSLKGKKNLTRITTNDSTFKGADSPIPSSTSTKRTIRKASPDQQFQSQTFGKPFFIQKSQSNPFLRPGQGYKGSGQKGSQNRQNQRDNLQMNGDFDFKIFPMQIREEQASQEIAEYLQEFRRNSIEDNTFLKSFPFDSVEIMTQLRVEQEANLFWIQVNGRKGLLATHIDRFDFSTRKLVISHLSAIGFDLPQNQEQFVVLLQRIQTFIFSNEPCLEITVALVTFEKDDVMFGVSEQMESAIKAAGFVQVGVQENYDTQLYYAKRPDNIPKKQQFQQIEPVFFELQSCLLAEEEEEGSEIKDGQSWVNNGTVNIAIMNGLNQGAEEEEAIKNAQEFAVLRKENELIRDIKYGQFQNQEELTEFLNKINFIFDYLPNLQDKQMSNILDGIHHIRYSSTPMLIQELIMQMNEFYLDLQGYSNILEWKSSISENLVYMAETHLTNTYFFIMQLEGNETQKDFDELYSELGQTEISTSSLPQIDDGKCLIFPQFSMKLKRERNISSGFKLYEQLLFANDFEQPLKTIIFRSYDKKKDVLIQKPFIFGMVNSVINKELGSVLFAARCD